jgi:hypothetical protein
MHLQVLLFTIMAIANAVGEIAGILVRLNQEEEVLYVA